MDSQRLNKEVWARGSSRGRGAPPDAFLSAGATRIRPDACSLP